MPDLIVQKYGGSSVADMQKLRLVAERVRRAHSKGTHVVVVVSAMGRQTEELFQLAEQARAMGGADQVSARELDMLATTGERVSMALLAIILQGVGVPAISLTGSQSGIITSDEHGNARVVEVKPKRIESVLETGAVAVVAGYQGVSQAREITTLGRGGSDTTAVALAAALHATNCEIYSDVDGVYTTDPRTVANAIHLPRVGYRFMQTMADAGAKVLSSGAVRLAQESAVRITARRTADLDGGQETLVTSEEAPNVRAVVEQPNVVCVGKSSEPRLVVVDSLNLPELERLQERGEVDLSERNSLISLIARSQQATELRSRAIELLPRSARVMTDDSSLVKALLPQGQSASLVSAWHQEFVIKRYSPPEIRYQAEAG